ncbi:MAG: hypothetical protein JWR72_1062 [Flavisolibacter sp.]|jgi:hypothetical protein|nr:hypothetical protein [Flavisolibacter sp.]
MQGSKIRLSDAEMSLFSNAEIILTKNSILQKTVSLLSQVQEVLVNESETKGYHFFPSPKISKGENYLGLPYIILDYPRISAGHDLLFVRSMFWWGNFFSSTLQLSGKYKEKYLSRLNAAYKHLSENDYFICINDDPWAHHFREDNYRTISDLSKEAFSMILEEGPYIKIAACWPLRDWDSAATKLIDSWKLFAGLTA